MTDDHGEAARDILAEQMYLEERGENDPDWRDAPFEIQRGYRSMIQRHMRHLSAAGYQIVPRSPEPFADDDDAELQRQWNEAAEWRDWATCDLITSEWRRRTIAARRRRRP